MIYIQPGVYVAADQIAKCELHPMHVQNDPDVEWAITVTLKGDIRTRAVCTYVHIIPKAAIDYWADPAIVAARHEVNRIEWARLTGVDKLGQPKTFTREEGAHNVLRKFIEGIEHDLHPDLDKRRMP